MSFRLIIDGSFESEQQDGRYIIIPRPTNDGGSVDELANLSQILLEITFAGEANQAAGASALRIIAKRRAGTKEDIVAAKYQAGQAHGGEKWIIPGELIIVDDGAAGGAAGAIVGRWTLGKMLVVEDSPDSKRDGSSETVVIHASDVKYTDTQGNSAFHPNLQVPGFE